MASFYVSLLPITRRAFLTVGEIVERLRAEFGRVEVDPDGGQRWVLAVINSILFDPGDEDISNRGEFADRYRAVQSEVVRVVLFQDGKEVAYAVVVPGDSLRLWVPTDPSQVTSRVCAALDYRQWT